MSGFWASVFALHLAVNAFANVYIAWLSRRLPKARGLVWQYVFAASFTTGWALLNSAFDFSGFIFGIGTLAAVGSYCQWQAYACPGGLSKTTLFVPLITVWAALLSVLFLPGEELLYRKSWLTMGIILLHIAPFFLARRKAVLGEVRGNAFDLKWLGYTFAMVAIQGGCLFFLKLVSMAHPITTFFSSWYVGGAVGALLLVRLREHQQRQLRAREVLQIIPSGASGCIAFGLLYLVLSAVPAGLVFPLKSFCAGVLPIVPAWFFLNEKRDLAPHHLIGFALGVTGVILVVLSQVGVM